MSALFWVIRQHWRPFELECSTLVVLHSQACAPESKLVKVDQAQYEAFQLFFSHGWTTAFSTQITRNGFPMLRRSMLKKKKAIWQIVHCKPSPRWRSRCVFFAHENKPFPPFLSQFGETRFGTKSDLLYCVDVPDQTKDPPFVDTKILLPTCLNAHVAGLSCTDLGMCSGVENRQVIILSALHEPLYLFLYR